MCAYVDVVKLLLQSGADLSARDRYVLLCFYVLTSVILRLATHVTF